MSVQFAPMQRSWQITPRDYGFTWWSALCPFLVTAGCTAFSEYRFGKANLLYAIAAGVGIAVIEAISRRAESPSELRLSDSSIESLYRGKTASLVEKHDAIHKDEIRLLREERHGLIIVGPKRTFYKERLRIVVPRALPEYEEIKNIVRMWYQNSTSL